MTGAHYPSYADDDVVEDKDPEAVSLVSTLGKPVGLVGAYFNTVCMMLGVGIFGLPSTVAKGGWVMLIIIPVLIVMACYTARLLFDGIYCDLKSAGIRLAGYPELGERVLGLPGLIVTHIAMKVTVVTVCGVMAFLGSTLARDFYVDCKYGHAGPDADYDADHVLKKAIIIFCASSVLPIMFLPTLKEVAWLSTLGAVVTFIVVVATLVVAASDHGMEGHHDTVRWSNVGDGFGTIVLGLGGAATMPSFEGQMQTGRRGAAPYKGVLVKVFATIAVIYMPVAFTGYYVYGKDVQSPILSSLPSNGAYLAIVATLRCSLALNCFVTHSLGVFVLAEEFERRAFGVEPQLLTLKDHYLSWHSPFRALGRAVLIAMSFLLAYFVPNFMALCDLTGSICVFPVYLLPCIFTLVLDRKGDIEPLGWPRRLWIVFIMITAVAGFVFGFKAAVNEIRDAFNN
eukprot:TRINITY_DN10869_c0_g1_i1.p1 TRINITY_DN10869_c0_g1~~TRINITY_DN10869_c0_g1_i1.p1  ORF type:complete len:477 (+),score=163.52 TRINITY_DN10869_c0_g1_i1:67-1431(+)